MTYLVERLAHLRRHLDHLRTLAPKVPDVGAFERDLSLQNDILFSLLAVCQAVIDIAGELASRRGIRFQDYTEAVRALYQVEGMPSEVVDVPATLPGFRNVLVHQYVALDFARVLAALQQLEPIETFARTVAKLKAGGR